MLRDAVASKFKTFGERNRAEDLGSSGFAS